MDDIQLFNDDCFNIFPTLDDKSINLFILDLPYGQTACHWDSVIDLEEMWKHIKRIMKPNALIVFFCTAKFGNTLINANPKWFKYDLIWKKSRKVGFLSANRCPLRQHENIYLFENMNEYNEEKEQDNFNKNIYLVDYSKKILKFIGKTKKEILKKNKGVDHFFRYSRGNFSLPIKENYEKLIKEYKIDEMDDYLEYDILKGLWEKEPSSIYNPQKTEGTPYKTIGKGEVGIYKSKRTDNINKGDRHPSSIIPEYEGDSILVYKNPHKTIHRTQKPVELLEWLIKTYSNEGDTVMDFTMGSGTCAVGCINTKRKFIGVEMDKEIYDLAFDRVEKHKKNID